VNVVGVDRLAQLGRERHAAVADPDQRQLADLRGGDAAVEDPAAVVALEASSESAPAMQARISSRSSVAMTS
jgi:hypothetical protein